MTVSTSYISLRLWPLVEWPTCKPVTRWENRPKGPGFESSACSTILSTNKKFIVAFQRADAATVTIIVPCGPRIDFKPYDARA